jgi:RNA polymerase sigma-70 factor (ECF subfamily)
MKRQKRKHYDKAENNKNIPIKLSIEHYRSEKRYVNLPDEIISLHSAHRDRKGQQIDQGRARRLVDQALAQLGMPRDREILRRYFLQDEDKQSICTNLGLSAEHFDRVLFRAKQRMRKLIEQQAELKSLLLGSYLDG